MQQTGRKAMVANYSNAPVHRRGASYLKVFVRLRPADSRGDSSGGGELPYTLDSGNRILIKGPAVEADGDGKDDGRTILSEPVPGAGRATDHQFQFHRVFDVDTEQDAVYREVASGMVQHGFRGYNGCVFVYGQTGSGKTHTMYGPDGGNAVHSASHMQGIVPRIVNALFMEAAARSPFADVKFTASLCEIYCDKIRDLGKAFQEGYDGGEPKTSEMHARAAAERHGVIAAGDPRGLPSRYLSESLELHEDGKGQVYVKGLVKMPMGSPAEVLSLVEAGFRLRATHETRMNATSSRSHTVFTIYVAQHDRGTGQSTQSALNFVDLAGSERLSRSESTGQRMSEALSINLSLTSLGKVVSSLGGDGPTGTTGTHAHIPFRDSKLTRMLQNSLGGSSYTTLLATIHPRACDHEETLSTLQFATRCQSVLNKPRLNFVLPGAEDVAVRIRQLEAECSVLRYRLVGERLGSSLRMIKLCADAGLAGALSPDGRFVTHPHHYAIGMGMEDALRHPYVRRALTLLVAEPSEEDEEVYMGLQETRAKILAAIAAYAAETGGAGTTGGGSSSTSRPGSAHSHREAPSPAASRPGSARSASRSVGGGGGGGGAASLPPVPPSLAYAGSPLTDATLAAALASAIAAMSTIPGGALHPSVAGVGAGGGFVPAGAPVGSGSGSGSGGSSSSRPSSASLARPSSARAQQQAAAAAGVYQQSTASSSSLPSPRAGNTQSTGEREEGSRGTAAAAAAASAAAGAGAGAAAASPRTSLLSPAHKAAAAAAGTAGAAVAPTHVPSHQLPALEGGGGPPLPSPLPQPLPPQRAFTTAYTSGGSAVRVSATSIPSSALTMFGGLDTSGGGGGRRRQWRHWGSGAQSGSHAAGKLWGAQEPRGTIWILPTPGPL